MTTAQETQPKAINHTWPAIFLLFLAPMTGEILSSSLPPLEFIQPFTMLMQLFLYGCGALLIRELMVRRKLGWMSVFLLGLAYGIYEEGVVVRSFFDPAWMDLGFYGTFGRWVGVNWIWTINLTIFHAALSILSPLLIVDVLFPAYRGKAWLKKGGLITASIAFGSMMLFGLGFGMKASLLQLAACFILIASLVWIALWIPPIRTPRKTVPKPRRFYWLGFLGMLFFFIVYILLPNIGLPAILCWWLSSALILAYLVFTRWLDQVEELFTPQRKIAFVTGTITLWLVFDALVRMDPAHTENLRGLVLFALCYLIALVVLWVKTAKQESNMQEQQQIESSQRLEL